MSHIHLPDGVIPISWWLPAYLLTLAWLRLALYKADQEERQKLPLMTAMGALMLLTMSLPLGPLPFHLNLTVLTGIIAGPWLGFVAAFVVNIILSLLGHGGITTIGLNSLLTGIEVVCGWWLYHRLLSAWRFKWRVLGTTCLALLLTVVVSLGLVWSYTGDLSRHEHLSDQGQEQEIPTLSAPAARGFRQLLTNIGAGVGSGGSLGVLALVLAMGMIVEAGATLGILSYLQRVRPELLGEE